MKYLPAAIRFSIIYIFFSFFFYFLFFGSVKDAAYKYRSFIPRPLCKRRSKTRTFYSESDLKPKLIIIILGRFWIGFALKGQRAMGNGGNNTDDGDDYRNDKRRIVVPGLPICDMK